ncbi:MAG: LLM class flavin-dependent oxidoreductase [Deltaproteobacteria bacterium]|nr:LLM class flavin-dependent oxidoreductase [Deltaproteobacteria bacterium]MCW5802022.1 LLM class flavin-dependent oxidoreductase [Deltaproteobacteria bacterium]
MKLSVLDLSPVGAGVAPSRAIRDSVELAVLAEQLGYERYWFAEHHNMPSIATSAPEILIAHVAAKTSRIRVGAGGIMIPNHAPLHVVETFRTLEALYPDRIDLGLGRAPGTDPVAAAALRRSDAEVNHQLAELLAFEDAQMPERHPFAQIAPMPSDVKIGAVWMLGSTLAGAQIAAALGLPYAFAGHFAMRHASEAIALYRHRFEPSRRLAAPYAICAVTAICADTDAAAEDLAAPIRIAVVNSRTGKRAPIPTVEEAKQRALTADERAICDEFLEGAAIGGPQRVRDKLQALAREVGADELMLSTLVPDLGERRASLERIARAAADQ